VPEWLSEEWLKEVAALAASRPPAAGLSGTVSVAVSIARGKEVAYHWSYRDGAPGEGGMGPVPDAHLVLTIGRDDARSIWTGEVEPSVAYMRGKLKASGDGALLLGLLESTATDAYRKWRQHAMDLAEPA
jgi:hypothetical protein